MIRPVEWKTRLKLLPNEDIIKLHEASLHILERTGMLMPLAKERLNDLSDFGLQVDRNTNIVRFPRDVVRKTASLWMEDMDISVWMVPVSR